MFRASRRYDEHSKLSLFCKMLNGSMLECADADVDISYLGIQK
jgi:hypothetical protein